MKVLQLSRSSTLAISLTKHKALELQVGLWEKDYDWFNLQVKWDRACDHAGFKLHIELLKFHLSLDIYDSRHWNYDANNWE